MKKAEIKKSFGASARVWRTRLGISQEELAGRAGLHRTYVSDIERGARNLSLESINKLADALEVPIATLFADLGEDPPGQPNNQSRLGNDLVEILFVEDNPNDVELTMQALKKASITNRIHAVADGAEALDFLFGTGKYESRRRSDRPQLILLDLGLPKISGLEILRRIKKDQRTRMIPVIVLTGSKQDRDVTASKQLGAEAYIVKPVDLENLSEVTARLSMHWALVKPGSAPALSA